MYRTLERLIKGDSTLETHIQIALQKWNEILKDIDNISDDELARKVDLAQLGFETQCGNDIKDEGQDIMAFTAIAQFYSCSDGFGERLQVARRIYNAIKNSQCSSEIKWMARKVANTYDLLAE